jgi:protein TonB
MNRLQKKCFIAAAGTHLLLVVAVLCSGFITSKPKVDDSQVLDVIPPNLIDAAFNSGVKGAKPPPPAPIIKPSEPQPPTPEPPKPEVKPVEPVKPIEPVKPPEDQKPAEIPEPKTNPQPHKIEVDLKPVVRKKTPVVDNSAAEAEKAAKEAKRLANERAKAFATAMHSIKKNSSTSTIVSMPGESSAAYASYNSAIASIYYEAWTPPDDASNDDSDTRVSITIARDGTVISARIVNPSGDARVDASVQRALDRVPSVPPLPDGTKENQRTLFLKFNLNAKRMIG